MEYGKNRRNYGTVHKAINAKEAALIVLAAADNRQIDENNIGHLSVEKMIEIAQSDWQLKLNGIIVENSGVDVYFDVNKLTEIAESPASANEISIMVSRRFRGAQTALNFMNGRVCSPNQEQRLVLDCGFVEKFLGPLWEDRLKSANIEFVKDTYDDKVQCFIPIKGIMAFAGAALTANAAVENKQPDRRRY